MLFLNLYVRTNLHVRTYEAPGMLQEADPHSSRNLPFMNFHSSESFIQPTFIGTPRHVVNKYSAALS